MPPNTQHHDSQELKRVKKKEKTVQQRDVKVWKNLRMALKQGIVI
jgi:hypothetical protein